MDDDAGYHRKYTERYVLLAYLNKMRDAVVRVSDGLTEQQVRQPGVPSGTNLLGLVHHLTGVEEHWFQRVFLGEQVVADKSMQVPAAVTREQVVTAYRRACARSDEIVRSCPICPRGQRYPTPARSSGTRCG